MSLPETLRRGLETHFGQPLEEARAIPGGDINHALMIRVAGRRYFVKWHSSAPAGMFEAEARGLRLLASLGAVRAPEVIAALTFSERGLACLILEWLDLSRASASPESYQRLGEGLAALHGQTQATHGLDHDNFIGSLPQRNPPTARWVDFYRDARLRPQMDIARERGYLPAARERLLNALLNKLPDLLPDAPPSLLHGDLWGGNYAILSDGTPALYDPAAYYGHREVEMAFTELFGGFPPTFYAAYNAVFPLETGYQERKRLYQLYPLMVHLNLFGEGYGAQVDSIARHYAR